MEIVGLMRPIISVKLIATDPSGLGDQHNGACCVDT